MEAHRPGPKPKRLYLRIARRTDASGAGDGVPPARARRGFLENLDRVGRLVAAGELTQPEGHLLVFRAADRAEAERILRTDPWKDGESGLLEWAPETIGPAVNLEPAPARGSGRLTALHRVAIVVSDQGESLRWYQEVLGLQVRDADPATGYVELSLSRGAAGLSLVVPQVGWGEPWYSEARSRIGQSTGIVFQTDSIPALQLRLDHARARVTEGPRPQPWGGVTLRFCDPDGNEFLAFQATPPTDRDAAPVRPRSASATLAPTRPRRRRSEPT